MQRLAKIRAAIQAKILAQYPAQSADAIEPYCRLLCRRALALAATEADAIEADLELKREDDCLRVTLAKEAVELQLAEEADALREAIPEVIEAIDAQAGDDDRRLEDVAGHVMQTFINGGVGIPPLSLEAIRARVDTGSYLISRWGGRDKELPAYAYWQHRAMVCMLAMEFDAPGMLNPYHPEHPEGKAEMCEELFPIEIAALRRLIRQAVRRVFAPKASAARNRRRFMAALDTLQRQFVGAAPEPPTDWLRRQ
jgi:hypothetical protein